MARTLAIVVGALGALSGLVTPGGAQARTTPVQVALVPAAVVPAAVVPAAVLPATQAPPFVTVMVGRSMWAQSEACKPIGVDLRRVAQEFAARGVAATGVVVVDRTAETVPGCVQGNLYPSWRELAELRDTYGWSFVSNGQSRADLPGLSPAARVRESCGSLDAFVAHGHQRAWGMFGPGSNQITDAIATSPVGDCFSFVRRYSGTSRNLRSQVSVAPFSARTDDTNGGRCNRSACSGNAGIGNRYTLPADLIRQLAPSAPDTWVILSTYKLVEGARLKGDRRWDCTSPDPLAHWTTEVESYCLADFLAVLDAIPDNARVVDPATVAEAYGRAKGPALPTGPQAVVPVMPARLADTRGEPTIDGLGSGRWMPTRGATLEVQVAGRAGVPADAIAAVLNVTGTGVTGAGFVMVWPCSAARPMVSTLNLDLADTRANATLVGLSATGKVCLYTQASTHLVVDVTGFGTPFAGFQPMAPGRALDTRPQSLIGYAGSKPTVGRVVELDLNPLPQGTQAVALNLTVTEPEGSGFVTAWPCDRPRPVASTVNFVAGQTVANAVVVAPDTLGKVCLYTLARTHLVADRFATISGSRFTALLPARLADTRGGPTIDGRQSGGWAPGRARVLELEVAGRAGVAADSTAAVLNVTSTEASAAGFVTVWPCGQPQPLTSTLNVAPGHNRPNATVVALGSAGRVCIFTQAVTHLVVDVTGGLR